MRPNALAIGNTSVRLFQAISMHQRSPRLSVRETQRRDLKCWGLKTKCKSLDLNNIAVKQLDVQEDRVRFLRCGCFHPLLGRPPTVGHQRHSDFATSNRGVILSTAAIYPTTNSSTSHPIETTTKKLGVLAVLPSRGFPLLSAVLVHALWLYLLPNATQGAALLE